MTHDPLDASVRSLALSCMLALGLAACSGNGNEGSTYRTSPEFRSDSPPPESTLGITLFGNPESDGSEGACFPGHDLFHATSFR